MRMTVITIITIIITIITIIMIMITLTAIITMITATMTPAYRPSQRSKRAGWSSSVHLAACPET